MTNKELKSEARRKLALNIHQAIAVYTIEFALFITVAALIVMSCVCLRVSLPAAIAMLCYGIVLFFAMAVGCGIINYAMIDYYLATYKCKPYNVRRLGETISRCNVGKVLRLNLIRTALGFLLLLLLIFPGVIYLSRTSMANHLLIANPSMSAKNALSASSKVMSGKTGAYFTLMFSMFGWTVIGAITLGLGFVFIKPYINLTKTEYYKRNLQGDVGVYKYVPQGGQVDDSVVYGNMSDAQNAAHRPEVRSVMPPVDDPYSAGAARPINIEPQEPDVQIAPIGTLSDSEVQRMNETMRGFGAPEIDVNKTPTETVVPEVVISSVTKPKKSITHSSVSDMGKPVDDSDLVEIVKPLTTREADEANVYDRKVNDLYSGSGPKHEIKHDYFATPMDDDPNDFVTTDRSGMFGGVDNMSDNARAAERNNDVASAHKPESDSVMSDEAFADFIKNFDDVPTPQGKFKPLTRSRSIDAEHLSHEVQSAPHSARPQRQSYEYASARRQPQHQPSEQQASQPQQQTPPQNAAHVAQADNAEQQLSRTERARRAREERLKNL